MVPARNRSTTYSRTTALSLAFARVVSEVMFVAADHQNRQEINEQSKLSTKLPVDGDAAQGGQIDEEAALKKAPSHSLNDNQLFRDDTHETLHDELMWLGRAPATVYNVLAHGQAHAGAPSLRSFLSTCRHSCVSSVATRERGDVKVVTLAGTLLLQRFIVKLEKYAAFSPS